MTQNLYYSVEKREEKRVYTLESSSGIIVLESLYHQCPTHSVDSSNSPQSLSYPRKIPLGAPQLAVGRKAGSP
jgi:hypothetical protein